MTCTLDLLLRAKHARRTVDELLENRKGDMPTGIYEKAASRFARDAE